MKFAYFLTPMGSVVAIATGFNLYFVTHLTEGDLLLPAIGIVGVPAAIAAWRSWSWNVWMRHGDD